MNIGRVLLMPKGDYSGTTTYNMLDWVRDNGKAWVCTTDGTVGEVPSDTSTKWKLLAQDGSVSGTIEWTSVNNRPFDTVKANGGINVDATRQLEILVDGTTIAIDSSTNKLYVKGGVVPFDVINTTTDFAIVTNADGKKELQLNSSVYNKIETIGTQILGVCSGSNATFTDATIIGGVDSYLFDVYCSNADRYIKSQSVSGNALTVEFNDSVAGMICVLIATKKGV